MDRISPNTLFHFTFSLENLIGILTNKFYPKYSLELGPTPIAYPMVCFCDILLSQVKHHMETYGYYGIGMAKEWAKNQGLSPVLYFTENSNLYNAIKAIVKNVIPIPAKPEAQKFKENVIDAFVDVLRHKKPYEGDLYRDTGIIPKVRFYDEREWRYVPSIEKCDECGARRFLYIEDLGDFTTRNSESAKIQKAKLSFEPKDIKYIIVKEESEIRTMVDVLEKIYGKENFDIVKILTTKVITSNQIKEDF